MAERQIKPSDIVLVGMPLTGTLGRSERECAAAIIVRACQELGDKWQAVSGRQIADVIRADVAADRMPFASLAFNPFFRPDVLDLVEKGFAARSGDLVELTGAGLAAIAKWARPEAEEVPHG